jgi:hypothetical protein
MASAWEMIVGKAAAARRALPSDFWREFIRVETDRFILVALIIYLHHAGASESLQGAAIGALAMSIQAQRYKRGNSSGAIDTTRQA